jgi:glycosyltransferase involved in cell wall biosynthesis
LTYQSKDISAIRLIFYLPSLKNYRDRVHLVNCIAEKVESVCLVVSDSDVNPQDMTLNPQLKIVSVPKLEGRRFPWSTYWAASSVVKELIKTGDFNIVHDTFGHLFPLMLLKRQFPECHFISSQYNIAEWDFRFYFCRQYGFFRSIRDFNIRFYIYRILFQRIASSTADCIVLQAPGLVPRLEECIPSSTGKIEWIPNNIARVNEVADVVMPTSQPFIRLLCAGGALSLGKGGDELFNLLERAHERKISIKATVLGGIVPIDVEYFQQRQQRLIEKDCLEIIGQRLSWDQVRNLYRTSEWLFHFTYVDGSPRTVLEALSFGLPVIGSCHPGIKVLDPDQQFIVFADPSNLDDILDELVDSKKNPDRYIDRVKRGLAYVKEHLTSDVISDRYVRLYKQQMEVQRDNA